MAVYVSGSQGTVVSKRRMFMPHGCLFFDRQTKDWWTYEFCYGRHIQQYHMEGDSLLHFPQTFTIRCGR